MPRVWPVRLDGWLAALLVAGLAVRLVGLREPLIDHQAWRQTDSAAIARNYFEEGYDLLRPRVDWRGAGPGYVEMNFPLYSFTVAGTYALLGGVHEWAGRLLSAVLSTGAAGLLYLLVRRLYQDLWAARLSVALFLSFPLSLYFGRAVMPEAAMLFLSVGALLAFDRWGQIQRPGAFLVAAASAALCFMVKIPTLYLGLPLVTLAWQRWGWQWLRRPALWLYLLLVLAPPALWYWHAQGLFEQTGLTFGIWNRYGYDKWAHGLLLEPEFYRIMLQRFGHDVFTLAGALLVLAGLLSRWGGRRDAVLYAWMGGLLAYVLLIPEGNRRLDYYQLPFAPVGAVLAGKALALLAGRGVPGGILEPAWRRLRSWPARSRVGLVLLLLAAVGAHSAWAVRDYYRPPHRLYEYYRDCYLTGRILDRLLPAGARLVVGDLDENAGAPNRAQSPTFLYYCHRKGWQITPDQFTGAALDSLAGQGADYFLVAVLFAAGRPDFWRQLPPRGIATPSAYPHFETDESEYRRLLAQQRGPDRNFALVRLRP